MAKREMHTTNRREYLWFDCHYCYLFIIQYLFFVLQPRRLIIQRRYINYDNSTVSGRVAASVCVYDIQYCNRLGSDFVAGSFRRRRLFFCACSAQQKPKENRKKITYRFKSPEWVIIAGLFKWAAPHFVTSNLSI